ncbi:hypothetical protein E3N88_33923 [Mikania micrantha]|uniref:acetyl-CoA C-acyltransferase n=1 Tax=Mikania micrantha TaxID=192012 RepID=A0A5N6MD75_9ASTR|nr:hypothetical protein E3N88_33923 [Mikania micrantha]
MDKAINRQKILLQHLQPVSSSLNQGHNSNLSALSCLAVDRSANHPTLASGDDVVIVAAYRTAQCKSKRGGFKDTLPDDLLSTVLKAVVEKTNVDPSEVGDIVVGTVLAPGSQRGIECRMAAIYAGFPDTVPIRTVNRQCSSGLQAVADVAAYIKAGFYEIGIGAGVESMSTDQIGPISKVNPKVDKFAQAKDCLLPMGITSENVAQRFGVTRQEQDQAAVESHRRAAIATSSGKFKDEIIPVHTKIVDPKTGEEKAVIITVDDGIRPNTNMADLAKLKPSFKKDGTTTAGTASQISDGAGAVLLMKRSVALKKGLPILGVFRSFEAVGVDPAVMGIGPAVAIPAAVKSAGARCVATLLHEMKRRGKESRFGVVSMCIGSGMGAAAVFEREN